MGMSTHVTLLRDKTDKTYQANLKVLVACQEAEIDPPKEIDEYFGGDGIDCQPEYPLEIKFTPKKYNSESGSGYEIDISSLPDGVKTIRFENCW